MSPQNHEPFRNASDQPDLSAQQDRQPAAGGSSAEVPSFSEATQALVEMSNRALRQSSEKLNRLEEEMTELRAQLASVSANLVSERERRLAVEAEMASVVATAPAPTPAPAPPPPPASIPLADLEKLLARPAEILQEVGERQKQLVESLEKSLRRSEAAPLAPVGLAPVSSPPLQTFLPALVGGLLGGSLVVLALQPWKLGRELASQPAPGDPSRDRDVAAGKTNAAKGTGAPARPAGTLHLSCAQPCWLDVRAMDTGKQVVYKTLSGSLSLPIGAGLDVFSGRADVLKVRLNDGPEKPFSTSTIVGRRRFLPPAN
jgi:hypothetical protein